MARRSNRSAYRVVQASGGCEFLQVKPWAGARVDICRHESGLLLALPLDRHIHIYAPCCWEAYHMVQENYEHSGLRSKGRLRCVCQCGESTFIRSHELMEHYQSVDDDRLFSWL